MYIYIYIHIYIYIYVYIYTISYRCHGCDTLVRDEICAIHGLPRSDKRIKLTATQLDEVLSVAGKHATFTFATPFHKKSLLLQDLGLYYGCADKVRASISDRDGRRRLASDILNLRHARSVSIRLSLTRESDRFTKLMRGSLETQYVISSRRPREDELRVLCLNTYLVRTALSEQ